jgi:hypothetical protein
MAKKRPEEIISDIKKQVAERFFAANPLKKFPEDFLSAKVKKELADIKNLPDLPFRPGKRITGRTHRDVRKKIDIQKVMAPYAYFKSLEAKMKYELVLLPGGKLKLNIGRKFEICSESGTVLLEFPSEIASASGRASHGASSLERAKYVLYARKEGQFIYKVPKSEIVVKKAVQKYENYLKEIRDKLIKAYLERGADKITAESLARQVFEEIDLPYIGGK